MKPELSLPRLSGPKLVAVVGPSVGGTGDSARQLLGVAGLLRREGRNIPPRGLNDIVVLSVGLKVPVNAEAPGFIVYLFFVCWFVFFPYHARY